MKPIAVMRARGLLSSGSATAYADAVAQDSPAGWWRFETWNPSGYYPNSVSGGEYLSQPDNVSVAGLIPGSSYARGQSGYISSVNNSDGAYNYNRNFAIECIFKANSLAQVGGLISRSAGGYALRVQPDGSLMFLKSFVAVIGSTDAGLVTVGTIYHAGVDMDAGGNWTIYLNGAQAASGTTTESFYTTNAKLRIGCDSSSSEILLGVIDEVAVYGHAIGAARFLAHAQAAGIAP